MGLGFRKCVHNCHGQQEKKCTLFECQCIFSAKVLIGDTSLAPTGDYPRIPRGDQLSRKKRQWPIIMVANNRPHLRHFWANVIFSIPP